MTADPFPDLSLQSCLASVPRVADPRRYRHPASGSLVDRIRKEVERDCVQGEKCFLH